MRPSAAIVVESRELAGRLATALAGAGFEAAPPIEPGGAERELPGLVCDLLVVDWSASAERPRERLARLRELAPGCEVLAVRADDGAEQWPALLAAGCLAVLPDSLSDDALTEAAKALRERMATNLARDLVKSEATATADPEPTSTAMRAVLLQAERSARSDASILLLGETGSGKGWLARRIHAASPRRGGSLVTVNCGAVPENLWESELFGHERGSFTGAERARRGRFELADGGTLFLDEIGDTPPHLQVKLLHALEHREIQRLGSERPIPVDTRIVAATNRDLEAEVRAGRFRSDLWYRLAVLTIEVPPLRRRREDLERLARSFLAAAAARFAKPVATLAPATLRALGAYDWPGNVRELANVVERAVLLAEGSEVVPGDLPLRIAAAGGGTGGVAHFPRSPAPGWLDRPLSELRDEVVATLECEYLRGQLTRTGGRLAAAAERAGIDRRTLHRKMVQYGLERDDFRRRRPRLVGRRP